MIAIAPLLGALVSLIAAIVVARVVQAQRARLIASYFVGTALAIMVASALLEHTTKSTGFMLLGMHLQLLPDGLLKLAPIVTWMAGLIAIAMSPCATHPPKTLARVLVLLAISSAFLAAASPIMVALLWAASAYTAWTELRERDTGDRLDRLFAVYHLPSVALFALGAGLLTSGSRGAGAVALISGIAIREAIVPVHSWLPRFVQRMPLAMVVAFVSPQLGVYAQLELLSSGLPFGLAHLLAIFGAVTAVSAAALGVVQTDARRALAYLIMSQTGLVAFGLESDSTVALTGALLTWQVLALATSGFIMTYAALEARRGKLSLHVPSGNFARTPRLAIAFLILGFASVGFPLTLGFVAEDLLVQGAGGQSPLLAIALIVATALNGVTVMRSFFYLFTGTRSHRGEQDLTRRERYAVTLAVAALLLAGIMPSPIVNLDTAPGVAGPQPSDSQHHLNTLATSIADQPR